VANSARKALKRKKQKDKALHKSRQRSQTLFFEGDQYRGSKYVPLMYGIESRICIRDEVSRREGNPGLTDQMIGRAYKNLIEQSIAALSNRPEALPSAETITPENHLTEDLLEVISRSGHAERLAESEYLGVLRTLNSSRVLWSQENGGDRGYIEYLLENIPFDPMHALPDQEDSAAIGN
jgi:hypothetical protein